MRYLRDPRVGWCIFGALAVAYAVAHVAAAFTEGVNWDEYALLWRVEKAVRTGVVDGGGRPGLTVIALYGLVDGCRSTESVVDAARVVWAILTLGILAGVFVFVARALRDEPQRWGAAMLATASLALVPVFMRWSLQVRSDQPAVLATVWAGVALLATRRRDLWAGIAGAMIGIGYLFSQKGLYVAGLVGVVVIGASWMRGELVLRELRRAAFVVGSAIASVVAYTIVVHVAFERARAGVTVGAGFDLFAWYREIVGFRVYVGMFETLLPLVLLVGLVLLGFARACRLRDDQLRRSFVVVAVLVVGVAVTLFHAAAFPYFWITLGLFPAVAIGLGWPAARTYFPRASLVVVAAALALFAWRAIPYRGETLVDTRAVQRESLDFVDGLPPALRGFHPDGGLACRRDPSPFPVYLRERVAKFATSPDMGAGFITELRGRPVAFIVRTYRLEKFPPDVRAFWADHYVPYRGTVELVGQRIHADTAGVRLMEIIVPERYRWISVRGDLVVGGVTLRPGETIALPVGTSRLAWHGAIDGVLVLAVDTPMSPARAPYYHFHPQMEITGTRFRW
ncbi:MAG: hypothetical protein ACKV2T_40300 [Kofleriaceae bacterium]